MEQATAAPVRERGNVKWFSAEKGYGFLVADSGGLDIFVHHSAIQMEGYRTLAESQRVTFETVTTPKGLSAANVQPVADGE